ncbi:hypothetical protein BZA05DRAFT_270618 [Tricharina praecox]|uniref:uncharacterized protein n=1 Tax=Tricharina praecox TaxID=43433 RepID=UPI0022201BFA|nr:uncharacterized protein BZA05DRAFT_270618 [Tricharina praecox]KAI5853819.1 hypothetical protein BZA05DRAFT_270618 [Tricharina praecox]
MPTPSASAPTNESSLVPPNPTPTTHSRRGSIPKSIPGWVDDNGGSYEDRLRNDMSLVAEAAKRASVAIVVRDLKDCRV